MGFDKNDPKPVVQPARGETKVNIGMIVAVLFFFVLAAAGIVWIRHRQ
jgi:hypothetical protein